jgi:hypothetical protein
MFEDGPNSQHFLFGDCWIHLDLKQCEQQVNLLWLLHPVKPLLQDFKQLCEVAFSSMSLALACLDGSQVDTI